MKRERKKEIKLKKHLSKNNKTRKKRIEWDSRNSRGHFLRSKVKCDVKSTIRAHRYRKPFQITWLRDTSSVLLFLISFFTLTLLLYSMSYIHSRVGRYGTVKHVQSFRETPNNNNNNKYTYIPILKFIHRETCKKPWNIKLGKPRLAWREPAEDNAMKLSAVRKGTYECKKRSEESYAPAAVSATVWYTSTFSRKIYSEIDIKPGCCKKIFLTIILLLRV